MNTASRQFLAMLLLAVLHVSAVFAADRPRDLVYRLPNMDKVTVRSNLIYKAAGDLKLAADLYLPEGAPRDSRLPAILFILGDAEPERLKNAKDWLFLQSYGRLAAASGYAGIVFDHRSSENQSKLPEVYSDIEDLIHYVRSNAPALNVDRDKLALWFFSGSGPHLRAGMGESADFVRCIVAYYTVLAPSSRAVISPELRRDYSSVEQLKRLAPKVPPLLMVKAGRDTPSLNARIEQFRTEARALNVPVDYLEHPEGQHAFDIRDDDETSREIIRKTMEFIKKRLP